MERQLAEVALPELMLRIGRELESLHALAEAIDNAIGSSADGRLSHDADARAALQNADLLRQIAGDLAAFLVHLAGQIPSEIAVSLDRSATPLKLAAVAARLHGRKAENGSEGDVRLF
ncbi:hypothetical protein DRV85_18665 [Rhodosalinus halophilus]|uniref:Uncharacterized protein n=1 Tax=Rhodosalinus halophilus TaxID=2259333 RepID=A0A365U4B7_9RHOB|nr:hypothetical protein [Rhodosalinus halophilus]RBI82561.1 hypothetical protein DRV85_18665 [Rhodosalinus halophilus]